MRAKMSEPGKTRGVASYLDQMNPLAVGYPAQRALVDRALREARAILEETEQRDGSGFSGHHAIGTFDGDALADSLAAFVAAEDTGAYLREGQS